jgi:hypothetical protein
LSEARKKENMHGARRSNWTEKINKESLRARQGEVTRRCDCMQKKVLCAREVTGHCASACKEKKDARWQTLHAEKELCAREVTAQGRVCMQIKKDARWQTLHAEKELCAREVTAQGRVCMQIKKSPAHAAGGSDRTEK